MELNDILRKHDIDLSRTIVMRHRPDESGLRKILPWMVHEHPSVFNAYQQAHSGAQEEAMRKIAGNGWIASFFGFTPGEAVFCGLYRIRGYQEINYDRFWKIPENLILREHGLPEWVRKDLPKGLWFDLQLDTSCYSEWIGKLVIGWPGGERSWWRRAEKNVFPVLRISGESNFAQGMPDWRQLVLPWKELDLIPASWKAALKEWRGIYLIRDMQDGLCYVGSAYGQTNLLGRWLEYAKNGDGGNKLLKLRQPDQFQFSILERLGPDLDPQDVVAVENSWKKRLGTIAPTGLNVT